MSLLTKIVLSAFILGVAVLVLSAGGLLLTRVRLGDLPKNPVNQLLKAEKKNLVEIEGMSQTGMIVGAGLIGFSGLAVAWGRRPGQ